MGFLQSRIIQTTKRYPAPRRCGVRVPVPRPPVAVRPTLYYHGGMSRDAGGNPAWRDEGATGATGVATGPGGAANPVVTGNGYPGYSVAAASSQYFTIGGANTLTGNPSFTMWAWANPTSIAGAISTGGIGTGLVLSAAAFFVSLAGVGILSVEFGGGNGARAAAASVVAGVQHFFSYSKTPGAINTTGALYQNGNPLALGASSANTPSISVLPGDIGRFPSFTNYWNGSLGIFGVCRGSIPAALHMALFQRMRGGFGV